MNGVVRPPSGLARACWLSPGCDQTPPLRARFRSLPPRRYLNNPCPKAAAVNLGIATELDTPGAAVQNANMAGRILSYLLSILIPLSPVLCGRCIASCEDFSCQNSAQSDFRQGDYRQNGGGQGNDRQVCCSENAKKVSSDTCPRQSTPASCSTNGQPASTATTPLPKTEMPVSEMPVTEMPVSEGPVSEVPGTGIAEQPERGPSAPAAPPCRHEQCRSAICAQSALSLRRVEWSLQQVEWQVMLWSQYLSKLVARNSRDASLCRWFSDDFCREVHCGPSGRAARIAFCSWLI